MNNCLGFRCTVFLKLLFFHVVQCQILIYFSGIMPIHRGDTGIVFWLTVGNVGNGTQYVTAVMFRCCEFIGQLETDCNHIKLVPSRRETLRERDSLNLSLIYPTLYPHHRRGTCQVDVKGVPAASSSSVLRSNGAAVNPQGDGNTAYNDSTFTAAVSSSVVTQNISFDTRILLTYVPPLLTEYYSLSEVKWRLDDDVYLNPTPETEVCDSPDEDPLDKCSPVDCAIKYSGTRSFFDLNQRRCLKVPLCLSDPNKKLPDVAYLPDSNTCRDLEKALDIEDIELFKYGGPSKQSRNNISRRITKLRCHNGKEDLETDSCICDEGWETYSAEEDERGPPLPAFNYHEDVFYVPLHMCTIQKSDGGPPSLVSVEELLKTPELIPVSLFPFA